MLGRFLEITLRAPQILASWEYYRRLGFAEATVGETLPHRYAAFTDGRLTLGLHDADLAHPALSYVRPELVRHRASLDALGLDFDRQVLGDDQFNELVFRMPDDQPVRLVEARTYSPPERVAPSLLGWFEEYMMPVASPTGASAAWERLGFVALADEPEPWPHVALTSDTLDLGLYAAHDLAAPALRFGHEDVRAVRERLAALEIEPEARLARGLDPHDWLLYVAPEGTRLLVGPPSG